jgi:hypothetical protein
MNDYEELRKEIGNVGKRYALGDTTYQDFIEKILSLEFGNLRIAVVEKESGLSDRYSELVGNLIEQYKNAGDIYYSWQLKPGWVKEHKEANDEH